MLDTDTVPEEQAAKVRERILVERMKRKTQKGKALIKKGAVPVFKSIGNVFRNSFRKVREVESKYKREAVANAPKGAQFDTKLKAIVDEAENFQKQEKFSEAEKKYIEVISLDPKNIDVYRKLAEVYMEMKEFKQARDTFTFVLKLLKKESKPVDRKDDNGQVIKTVSNAIEVADAHIDLGEVYEKLEDHKHSMANYQLALDLEPNNPRNLDQMLNLSIEIKDKNLSVDLLNRLDKVNPDNQKLKEYQEKINQL